MKNAKVNFFILLLKNDFVIVNLICITYPKKVPMCLQYFGRIS